MNKHFIFEVSISERDGLSPEMHFSQPLDQARLWPIFTGYF